MQRTGDNRDEEAAVESEVEELGNFWNGVKKQMVTATPKPAIDAYLSMSPRTTRRRTLSLGGGLGGLAVKKSPRVNVCKAVAEQVMRPLRPLAKLANMVPVVDPNNHVKVSVS